MAYEQKPNTGTIFFNAQKTSDKHPDRKGSAKIVCPQCQHTQEWEQAGWIATDKSGNVVKDKNGNPMLNVKYSISDRQETKAAPADEESIPF